MSLPATIVRHFDQLSMDRQVDLLHELWRRIASQASAPVPNWHRTELQQREGETRSPTSSNTWEAVRERLLREIEHCGDRRRH